MPSSLTMTAPADLKQGSMIQAFDGSIMVNVCVPSDVQKGDQFAAIVLGPSADDEEAPRTVKASPMPNSSWTEDTTSSSAPSSPNNMSVNVLSPTTAPSPAPAKKKSCMATAGMVCGILGLFFFGIILGPLAIILSGVALCKLSENPNENGGRCQANAGLILGIIDVVVWVILLAVVLGA